MKKHRLKSLPPGLTLLQTIRVNEKDYTFAEMRWSPNGRFLAAQVLYKLRHECEGFLRVFDLETGEQFDLKLSDDDDFFCFTWSPDGQRLVIGGGDLHIFDRHKRQEIQQISIDIFDEAVYYIAWTPDGQRILTAGNNFDVGGGPIYMFEVETGERRHEMNHSNGTTSMTLSPDGRTMITTGTGEDDIRFWDVATGECYRTWPSRFHRVTHSLFTPDGSALVVSYRDASIRIWNLQTGEQTHALQGHSNNVLGTSFSHDGRWMASHSTDGTVRIWRWDRWEMVAILPVVNAAPAFAKTEFHTQEAIIAVPDENDRAIHLIRIDVDNWKRGVSV